MGGLFKPKTPDIKMPDPPRVQRMPVESDTSVREARLRRQQQWRQRMGRGSTILTDELSGGTLG